MEKLYVFVARLGTFEKVGELIKDDSGDVTFIYNSQYLNAVDVVPISIGLPLQEEQFDTLRTEIFFDGLLPEGFLRRTIAANLKVEDNDYFSILKVLGHECLGAVWIFDPETDWPFGDYIEIDEKGIYELAREGASESVSVVLKTHLSLTGASGKVGLYYDENNNKWYLPCGAAPSTHIVKQSHVRLQDIVINEQLSLLTARNLGIDVPESFIIKAGGDKDNEMLFATKRYDRMMGLENDALFPAPVIKGLQSPYRLHQEDFSQALGIHAKNKYEKGEGSYLNRAFELVRNYSSDPLTDVYKLWDYLIFDYLIGNTDNHIKNLSLLYSPDLQSIRLAPLYDAICTTMYESSTREMSVSIDGRYIIDDIKRESFENVTGNLLLGRKLAMEHFDRLADKFESAINEAAFELADEGFSVVTDIKDKILASKKIDKI